MPVWREDMVVLPLMGCALSVVLALLWGCGPINRRVSPRLAGWLLSMPPAIALGLLLGVLATAGIEPQTWSVPWIPALGANFALRLDGLSLLFSLLITGIGALVMIYAGYYFSDDRSSWRFLTYLSIFTVSMLGLVQAADLLLLIVFWEGTSIASFLLIGYKREDPAARVGALKSLLITAGGGVALLIGLALIVRVTGTTDLNYVLESGHMLRDNSLYPLILALVLIGAFTKSAQVPFHVWLPDGMTAPTPASAFLHSATMVKAGVYLLARLNPALGMTEPWFWALSIVGGTTMLLGAFLGLRAFDLKGLLAYSTISQLGALVMLVGQDTPVAYKALALGILAHALYKSSLFMIVGIVDHETHTRDLRKLGGLARAMPITLAVATVAALSMAGLPPLFGYLAKEALVSSAVHSTLPGAMQGVFAIAAVVAGALMLAQAVTLVWDTFVRKPDPSHGHVHGHDPALGMLLGPAVPALLSLIVAFGSGLHIDVLLASAASEALGQPVPVVLKFWKGLDLSKALGLLAIGLGVAIFFVRYHVRLRGQSPPGLLWNWPYVIYLRTVDGLAWLATRVQTGQLHFYLLVMIAGIAALLVWGIQGLAWTGYAPDHSVQPWPIPRAAAAILTALAALATVFLKRDLEAILSLGASGLGVAMLFLLQPAPDVALVMILVDVLTVVVLVLALSRISPQRVHEADLLDFQEPRAFWMRDAVVATVAGVSFTMLTLFILHLHPRSSVVSPFYLENAKTGTGATDVVGAIVIDFRGLDTLIEITVFSLAGLGVFTLLRHASKHAGDEVAAHATGDQGALFDTPMMRLLANAMLPMVTMIAATYVMYGHDQPGDGFTAGVIVSLAVGFRHVVLGYHRSRSSKPWLRSLTFVGAGLLLAVSQGTAAYLGTGHFYGNVDFGKLLGLPLPRGFALSTSMFFELSICLAVLGGATLVINTLSRPTDPLAGESDDVSVVPMESGKGR